MLAWGAQPCNICEGQGLGALRLQSLHDAPLETILLHVLPRPGLASIWESEGMGVLQAELESPLFSKSQAFPPGGETRTFRGEHQEL